MISITSRSRRAPSRMRFLPFLLVALAPAADAVAQAPSGFEASAGFYVPNTFGGEPTGLGWMVGGRFAMPVGERLAAFGHYTIASVGDIAQAGEHPDFVTIGLGEHTLTGGVDYALRSGFRVELAAGALARRNFASEVHGSPPPTSYPDGNGGDGTWGGAAVLVPGVSWGVDDVVVRLRNMVILDDFDGAAANVSLTMGLRF